MSGRNNRKSQYSTFFQSKAKRTEEILPDRESEQEKGNLFIFKGSLEKLEDWIAHQEFLLKKDDYRQNRKERKKYAKWSYWIVSAWLFWIVLLVSTSKCLHLDNSVLITLLTTTTINVLGLVFIVSRYLFPDKKT